MLKKSILIICLTCISTIVYSIGRDHDSGGTGPYDESVKYKCERGYIWGEPGDYLPTGGQSVKTVYTGGTVDGVPEVRYESSPEYTCQPGV